MEHNVDGPFLTQCISTDSLLSAAEGNARRATDAERQFLADSRVFASKPSQASLLSVEAVCVVLKRANLPAAQIAAVQKLQGAAALSPAQLAYMSRVSLIRPRRAPKRRVQLEAAHREEAQQEPSQAGRQPASAAPEGAKAGPLANGSTLDAQRHADGGTNGASPGQLKQGMSKVKAHWSSHSSDSELQENGLPGGSQGNEADGEGQPTQADLQPGSQKIPEKSGGLAGIVHPHTSIRQSDVVEPQ